jgi:hypothetical protein
MLYDGCSVLGMPLSPRYEGGWHMSSWQESVQVGEIIWQDRKPDREKATAVLFFNDNLLQELTRILHGNLWRACPQ